MMLLAMALALQTPGENGCNFTLTYEGAGETRFIVMQTKQMFDDDNTVVIGIFNDNWSLKAGDKVAERITIDAAGYSFWQDSPTAVDNGVMIESTFKHVEGFFDSYPSSVTILKGRHTIDRLNFSGSSSKWQSFRSCRYGWVQEKEKQDRLKALETLPKDPFAPKK